MELCEHCQNVAGLVHVACLELHGDICMLYGMVMTDVECLVLVVAIR